MRASLGRTRSSAGVGRLVLLGLCVVGLVAGGYVAGYAAGLEAGREEVKVASAPLVPEEVREETLLDLLQRVEEAAAASRELAFPEGLAGDGPPDLAPRAEAPGSRATEVPAPRRAPDLPAPDVAERPAAGSWTVQVLATRDAGEAAARVAALRAAGLPAWRAEALVDGDVWHRVRVGGWPTPEEAEAHLDDIRAATGQDDLFIAQVE